MRKAFKYILFFLLIFLLILRPEVRSNINANILNLYLISFLSMVVLHLYIESKIYRNWFRIDVFFLLGFTIVHFQWLIMYRFSNLIPKNLTRIWIDDDYLNYGTWLSVIGGVSFLLGYWSLNKIKKNTKPLLNFNYTKLLYFTIALFALFLLSVGSGFFSGARYIKGESYTPGGLSSYIKILFSISLTLLTVFVVLNNKNSHKKSFLRWMMALNKSYLILVLVYVITFLAAGDRGGPISLILTLFILIGSFVRPFKLKELVLAIVVGASLMTIISLGRGVDSNNNILESGYENLELNSGYDFTLELANSVRTLYTSVSQVPMNHDFFYGQLWSGNVLSVVPFAQTVYVQMLGVDNEYLGSAEYITFLTFGKNPRSGEGTSLIADIYLNFGPVGVVLLMFVLGFILKKLNLNLLVSNDLRWIIVAAIFGGVSFYLGRSTFFVMLRPVIWSFPLTYFLIRKNKI
tara:strand:+ start:5618 stop:7003 length:1386 start_codon:yes stop_codon:yes gene_type:complete